MKEKQTKKNQSVGKMFLIIEVMAEQQGPMRLQDISTLSRYPASTALRLLHTLMSYGYVHQDMETLKYSLSMKFCRIAEAVKSQTSIRDIAHPHLVALAQTVRETTCLAVERDTSVVYIDCIEGPDKAFGARQGIGWTTPLHACAAGKLLLLNYTDSRLLYYISQTRLEPLTPKTITTPEMLCEELSMINRQGFALDDEESETSAWGMAAPIRDYTGQIMACVALSGPLRRMTPERLDMIKETLLAKTREISRILGYSGD